MHERHEVGGQFVWREETPAPNMPEKRYLVEAVSANPYRKGFVEVYIDAIGMRFRWYGEKEWSDLVEWVTLMAATRIHNEMLRDDLRFIRKDAADQGYKEGYAAGLKAAHANS